MNELTILIWVAIALIGIISIIIVKLSYKDNESKNDDEIDILNNDNLNEDLSIEKDRNSKVNLSPQTPKTNVIFKKRTNTKPKNNEYIVPEVEKNNLTNYDYESQNKVLINYDNKVKKFQEPIKQSQIDIMSQNIKNKDETELKDLFTIDELIKESKRKDSQREKESKKIKKDDEEDKELDDIKESIKNRTEQPLIEEIIDDKKENNINSLLKEDGEKSTTNVQSVLTQEEIDNAISIASKEKKEEKTNDTNNITNVLLNQEKEEESKIKEPVLKTPSKINTEKDEQMAIPIDDSNLFKDDEEEGMDLDYRKDLDKFTNKIKGSKLYQEVKDKLTPEVEEFPPEDEMYIRNVNDYDNYDDYEPIVNETHIDYESKYVHPELSADEKLRQENSEKIFNIKKDSKIPTRSSLKSKSSKDNIKLTLNNNEYTLKKGDEIIFNHLGETYSSQVYSIKGDDISVKYRRKYIKIKPKDVKKIY